MESASEAPPVVISQIRIGRILTCIAVISLRSSSLSPCCLAFSLTFTRAIVMAARPVFAVLDNVPLPGPALATLRLAEQDLPATTAYPPTADDLKKAHKVGTEYRHIADVYNPVAREYRARCAPVVACADRRSLIDSPAEFKQNQSAAELYAVAVENLAATKYLTPTPGEGQGGVPEPVQPGPTFLALQGALLAQTV